MVPVMPNSGTQAAILAHFEFESGVKFGRAGISGGKNRLVKCAYTSVQEYKAMRSSRRVRLTPLDFG